MKHERIKSVAHNNRTKELSVTYESGKRVTIHFGQLGLTRNLSRVWVDTETGGRSIGIQLDDGEMDFVPYDQPLALAGDPDFLLQHDMEVLVAQIRAALGTKRISKRYLARQLHTSDNQVQRLLDPSILNKNLSQLYRAAALVGLTVNVNVEAA